MDQARNALPVPTNVTKLRNKALATRIKVQEAHDNVVRCLDHFADSHATFLRLMDRVEMEALPPSLVDLKKTGPLLTTDGHALRKAVEDLRPLVEELKNVDYELFNAEPIPQYFLNLDNAGAGPTSTILPRAKGGNERDDEDLHPLLEEYFDLLGDIKLAQEHLEDWLPREQAERRAKRQLRMDQGESPDDTDEEFEDTCVKETAKFVVELKTMEAKAVQLREKCKNEGLDIDPSNHVRKSETASSIGEPKGNVRNWLDQVETVNDYAMTGFDYDREAFATDLSTPIYGSHQQPEVLPGLGNEVELPSSHEDAQQLDLGSAESDVALVQDDDQVLDGVHSPDNFRLSNLPADFVTGATGDHITEHQKIYSQKPLAPLTTQYLPPPTSGTTYQVSRLGHDMMVNQAQEATSFQQRVMPNDSLIWFRDAETNRLYCYDATNDELVYDNGTRCPRPSNIPRSAFQTAHRTAKHGSQPHGHYTETATGRVLGSSPTAQSVEIPLRSTRDVLESLSPMRSSLNRISTVSFESSDYGSAPRTPFRQQTQLQQPYGTSMWSTPLSVVSTHSNQHFTRPVEPAQVEPIVRKDGNRKFIDTYDQQRNIRVLIQIAPAEQITDPVLLKTTGRPSSGLLLGTLGEQETLHSNFRTRPHGFFTLGRVFKVLWVEKIGEDTVTSKERADSPMPGAFSGERVYSKVRRFVVIRPSTRMASVLPIVTYGVKGVGKAGVVKSEHVIIHTSPNAPEELPSERPIKGEKGMWPAPIRVVPDNPADQLDPMSRIQLVQVSTVQHNIKVQPFGVVHQNSIAALQSQFSNAFNDGSAELAASSTKTESARPQESVSPTQPRQEFDNDLRRNLDETKPDP